MPHVRLLALIAAAALFAAAGCSKSDNPPPPASGTGDGAATSPAAKPPADTSSGAPAATPADNAAATAPVAKASARDKMLCMTNLRSIGQAIVLWGNTHDSRTPEVLQDLVDAGQLPEKMIACPATGKPYVYMPHNLSRVGGGSIVACEIDPADERRVCLFGDGHVEQLEVVRFTQLLSAPENKAFADLYRALGGK